METWFRVVENYVGWWRSIFPPGGVGEPLVCLPSALATGCPLASWASGTQGRPKERVGWLAVGLD